MHISKVKPGDVLVSDGDFKCLRDGAHKVYSDDAGLYVPCTCGRHYLASNAIGDLVGLYPPVEFKTQQTGAST